jgi:hypothetical protein
MRGLATGAVALAMLSALAGQPATAAGHLAAQLPPAAPRPAGGGFVLHTITAVEGRDPSPPPDGLQGGLIAAGDLNGDGLADVLDVRYTDTRGGSVVTVVARVGDTGKPLWHKEVRYPDSDDVNVAPTRLGPHGRPGVLLIQDTERFAGHDNDDDRQGERFTALAGRSGRRLWSQWIVGGRADQIEVDSITDELPGRASDVLLSISSQTSHYSRLRPVVVSGVDGHIVRLPAIAGGGEETRVYAVPDLNDDGLNDVVINRPTMDGTLRAEQGRTGKLLWVIHGHGIDPAFGMTAVGRISGGNTPDLVASMINVGDRKPGVKQAARPEQMLIRGSDGRILWDKPGDVVVAVHRAGRELVPAVELIDTFQPDEEATRSHPVGIIARAYTPSGHRLFERRVLLHTHPGADAGDGEIFLDPDAGDIEPDGAGDISIEVVAFGSRPYNEMGFVDGRTGRFLPRQLGAAVDAFTDGSLRRGRGTDIIDIEPAGRRRDAIRGIDGVTGHRYFSRDLSLGADQVILETFGIHAAGGSCSDIALTTEDDPGDQFAAVMSGSGHVLWTLRYGINQRRGGTLTRHPLPRHLCA